MARAVHAHPEALTAALDRTPTTFVHGDWKLGNLGLGRPTAVPCCWDWAFPGAGPACWDLGWYLCLNAARIPEPKEDAAEAFRSALERHGVVTASWFDHQLALELVSTTSSRSSWFDHQLALELLGRRGHVRLGEGPRKLRRARLVGGAGAARGPAARPRGAGMAVTDHSAGTAPTWAAHASRVYGPLAAELLAAAPHPVRGRRVLDAGAGTGLVSDVLRAAGARPVAVDLSLSMLRWRAAKTPAGRGRRPVPVADARRGRRRRGRGVRPQPSSGSQSRRCVSWRGSSGRVGRRSPRSTRTAAAARHGTGSTRSRWRTASGGRTGTSRSSRWPRPGSARSRR